MQAVQFHPESIITQDGKKIVANFLEILKMHDAKEELRRLGLHLDQWSLHPFVMTVTIPLWVELGSPNFDRMAAPALI